MAQEKGPGGLRLSAAPEVQTLHCGSSEDWPGPGKAVWAGGCVLSAGHVDDEVGRKRLLLFAACVLSCT